MRAVTLDALGAAPGLRDDLPAPTLGAGEVLVRVKASSVNPADIGIAAGMLKDMVEHAFPVTLGRDFAGTVEQVADGVTSVAVGDEVFGLVPAMAPAVHDGAWAELIAVSEAVLAKRPVAVELAVAGAAPLAAVTAVMAVDAAAPGAGEVVLVVGATGGVGSVAVQLAVSAGAAVIAPALSEDEDYLRGLGVSEVVARDGDVAEAVRDRVPDGVDVLIDVATFTSGGFDAALKDGARVASATNSAGEGPGRSNVISMASPEILGRIAGLLADGTVKVPIAETYELADAPRALQNLAAKHTRGKLALRIS
jgi:NADPH:quinone reductase-like Zn-dependent oxidoreductase